jgi:transcriptional regulator with XRE-family HTH domain
MAVGTVTGIDLMVERKMRGVSQSAVAVHMGTSKQYVSTLEGNLTDAVTPDAARKYRDALDAAAQERESTRPLMAVINGADVDGGDDYATAAAWTRGWLRKAPNRSLRWVNFHPGSLPWEGTIAVCDVLTAKGVRVAVVKGDNPIRRVVR